MHVVEEDQWLAWLDLLSDNDYLVIDDFISDPLFQDIRSFFKLHIQDDSFDEAGIGTINHTVNQKIRGDQVFWLDKPRDHTTLSEFYELIDEFKDKLNRYCFLGVSDYEFHLAYYQKGTFYKRHLDQFKERNNRMITLILYLNEDWQEGDGGELMIYTPEDAVKVAPIGKRLVIFKSDVLEHEVLETHKGRYSITGWYLKQPVGLGFLGVV